MKSIFPHFPPRGIFSLTVSLTLLSFNLKAENSIWATNSGNWNDPNIWSCHCVPTMSDNVTIGADNWLTINLNAAVRNLIIEHNGGLEFSWQHAVTLTISGDLTCNGFIDPGMGTVSFISHRDQSVSGFVDLYRLNAQGKKKLTVNGYVNVYHSIHATNAIIHSHNALHLWTENPVFKGIYIEDGAKLRGDFLLHGVLGIVQKTEEAEIAVMRDVSPSQNHSERKDKYGSRPTPTFKSSDIRPLHERIFDRNQALSKAETRMVNQNR